MHLKKQSRTNKNKPIKPNDPKISVNNKYLHSQPVIKIINIFIIKIMLFSY